MATQICPCCKQDSFTWFIEDEKKLLTRWGCYNCSYTALENEKDEMEICQSCQTKTKIKLNDELRSYWWCSNCNTITNIASYV
jgi:hypothetical protein